MINLAMGFFFNFATICAMAVCFFSLMSSMYTNIHEQTHEIAILQALGLPVAWLRRIYIFEAFVLIITASL
jgi:ABC-type lipoprotein release transport system permease subunit